MEEWTQVHTNTLLGIEKGFRKPDDIADSYFVMWKKKLVVVDFFYSLHQTVVFITLQELNKPKRKKKMKKNGDYVVQQQNKK